MIEKQLWSVPVTCLAIMYLYYVSCLELFWYFYVCDLLLNMPPIQSTLRNKKLHSLTREVIYSAVNFMEYYSVTGYLQYVHERTAEATGVSLLCWENLTREEKN